MFHVSLAFFNSNLVIDIFLIKLLIEMETSMDSYEIIGLWILRETIYIFALVLVCSCTCAQVRYGM